MNNPVLRGRIIFVALVLMFALPAVIAKTVLVNHWYHSGVTNKGVLVEPKASYQSLGMENPYNGQQWQLAYVLPAECDQFCQQQVYLLGQSHIALGKYQSRVAPVLLVSASSDLGDLPTDTWGVVSATGELSHVVADFEYVIVDPLGQLVMRYPKADSQDQLINQSKDVLADLRKLLKLSRVG